MENKNDGDDLASRIASKLESGAKGRAKQRLDVHDRLKVWVNGKCLCDPETEVLIVDITCLRRWYMTEGFGRISFEEAADLWADVLQLGGRVDLGLWRIGSGWYYDAKDGKIYCES